MNEEKKDHAVRKALAMVGQVGISMITPVLLCGLAGYYMDKNFHTAFWFILLIILGIIAAFRNVYLMLLKFYKKELTKEKEQQQYEEGLKNHSKIYGTENIDDLKTRRIKNRKNL